MKYVYISSSRPFVIGRQGENEVTTVRFAINKFFPDLTNATFGLLHQRPGDAAPYICSITNVDGFIDWVITSGDLANVGSGTAQLSAYVDNKIAKTAVFTTMVLNSMGAFDPPDPQQIWIDEVIQAGNDAKAAAEQAEEIRDSIKPEIVWVEVGAAGSVIEEAYNAGKLVMCKDSGDVYQLTFRDSDERYVFTAVKDRVLNTRIVQYDYWFPVLRSSLATVVYVDEKASDDAPADLAVTPSAGISHQFSRADHVHKKELLVINEYETSNAKIEAAYQAGVLVLLKYQQGYLPLVSRNSATKHTFIGFAEPVGLTQAVLNNGTWSFSSSKVVTQSFAANTAPKDLGAAASSGSSDYFSRADHVHKLPSAADIGAYVKPSGGIPASDLASGVIPETEVFWATYGTTTNAQIEAAYQAGKIVMCLYNSSYALRLTYRPSASRHRFSAVTSGGSLFWATCENDSWTHGSEILAPANSPYFTGTPKAPTAASGTNTTQIATTAFVQQALDGANEVFWATYGTTTYAELNAAYEAGKILACKRVDTYGVTNQIFTFVERTPNDNTFRFACVRPTGIYYLTCNSATWSESNFELPSTAGTYALKVVNNGGVRTYSWVAQS